jgi:hypothetical protein
MENFKIGQRINVKRIQIKSWYSEYIINNCLIEEIKNDFVKVVFDEKTTKNGEPTYGGGIFYTDVYEITPITSYFYDFYEKIVTNIAENGFTEISADYAQKLIDQQSEQGQWVYWNSTELKRFTERENFMICILPIYEYKLGEIVKVEYSFYNSNNLLAYVNTYNNEHFEYDLLRKHFDISNVFETQPKCFSTI